MNVASAGSTSARACSFTAPRASGSSARSGTTTSTESASWLAAALEAADSGFPGAGARPRAGQLHGPRGRPRAGRGDRARARTAAAPRRSRSPSRARPSTTTWRGSRAVRDGARAPTGGSGSTRTAAGRSRRRSRAIARAERVRPRVRRAAVADGRGAAATSGAGSTCRSPPTSRSGAPRDPLRVAQLDAADIAVLKVQPLGGVRACLRLAEQIGDAGRRVERARVVGRDRCRRRVGGGACPSCRTRAGWRRRRCSPPTSSRNPGRAGRRCARRRRPRSTTTRSTATALDETHAPMADRSAACARVLGEPPRCAADAWRISEPMNDSTRAWRSTVVAALRRAGVTDVVLAPGSRSARARALLCTRPTPTGCSGCTCGSTSERPASSPSAWPRARIARSPS